MYYEISRKKCRSQEKVEAIYNRLNYKSKPFVKRKSVVHKSDFEKFDLCTTETFNLMGCNVG